MKHILIVGERGVGKSTLIGRLAQSLARPVFGFETKKEDAPSGGAPGSPVYIYRAGAPHLPGKENLVGYCGNRHPTVFREAFDRFAPNLQSPPENCLIVLDELGFMESESEAFCRAVLTLLDGDVPVIAAVKNKDTPFLCAVRAHPKATCCQITRENRDELFLHLREALSALPKASSPK